MWQYVLKSYSEERGSYDSEVIAFDDARFVEGTGAGCCSISSRT